MKNKKTYTYEDKSALALARKGQCCGAGCAHCPYTPRSGGSLSRLSGEGKKLLQEHENETN